MYTWGWNLYGQLGAVLDEEIGAWRIRRYTPTKAPGLGGVVSVAAGSNYSLALCTDGTTMACGGGSDGQLGLGDVWNRYTFTTIPGLADVVDIDAGRVHSIAVTAAGVVWTWGMGLDQHALLRLNPTLKTGGGIESAVVVRVTVGEAHSMALAEDGRLFVWGNHRQWHPVEPTLFGVIPGRVANMASGSDALVTTVDGDVLSFSGTQADKLLGPMWTVPDFRHLPATPGGNEGNEENEENEKNT